MKRTVFYIMGSAKVHRSKKCALSGKYASITDLREIIIPENIWSVMDYVRGELSLARVCLRCWDCDKDNQSHNTNR